MKSPDSNKPVGGRWLEIEEVRLISDLRVMHAKVDDLHGLLESFKRRHDEGEIVRYSDYEMLEQNIRKVDEIYMWFVKVKERRDGAKLGD
jgi:hypothetical protein